MINGEDYNTQDGTCIRDYTHVNDVARAFLSTAYYMFDQEQNITVNIGNNNPVSMKELVGVVEQTLSTHMLVEYTDARAGDMTQTHADIEVAKSVLGWEPTNSIQQIVEDEIKWQKTKIKKR